MIIEHNRQLYKVFITKREVCEWNARPSAWSVVKEENVIRDVLWRALAMTEAPMLGFMTTLYTDGTSTTKTLTDTVPTLEDLQEVVDGYIERVPGVTRWPLDPHDNKAFRAIAFCNEEGLRRTLPPNPHVPGIVGNVVVLYGDKEFLEAL